MASLKHVIQISDTHIGPSEGYDFMGCETLPRARQLVEAVNALDFEPDAVIHTGDVVDEPTPEAYRLAAEVFGELRSPVYYVRGNHDGLELLLEHLPMGKRVPLLEDDESLAYRLDAEELSLYVLDGWVKERNDARGEIPEAQLEALRLSLEAGDLPAAVFVHFPPFGIDSPWIEREMLLVNGGNLHEILRGMGANRIRGVFFGHIHSNGEVVRDGIVYCGLAGSCCQFTAGPGDEEPEAKPDAPACFNHLTFLDGCTVIKRHTVGVGLGLG